MTKKTKISTEEQIKLLEEILNRIPTGQIYPDSPSRTMDSFSGTKGDVSSFLKILFEVYSSLVEQPDALNTFVQKTTTSVQHKRHTLNFSGRSGVGYYVPTSGGFSLYGINEEAWATMCLRRSEVEILNELYSNNTEDEYIIDTESMDDDIRYASEYEGGPVSHKKPASIKKSHWWWDLLG